jgi:hypothetical protein
MGEVSMAESDDQSRRIEGEPSTRGGETESADEEIVYIYDDEGRLVEDMTENGRAWTDRVRRETKRGGHLIKLFWYGTLTTLVAVFLVLLSFFTMDGWRMRATLFWIRTMYCLFLCPFIIFKVPMMMQLLTRSQQTGYDKHGRTCVQKKRARFAQGTDDQSILGGGFKGGGGGGGGVGGGVWTPRRSMVASFNGGGGGRLSLLKKSLQMSTGSTGRRCSEKKQQEKRSFVPIRRL